MQAWLNSLALHSQQIIFAVLIALVGFTIARIVRARITALLRKHTEDPTVKLFLVNAAYGAILLAVLIVVLSELGVSTGSLLTLLGAGSLAIGLALKDSLSNIASGLLMIMLHPFKIGDVVEIGGVLGTVDEINLFNTRIKTPNNELIYFPNAKVMNDKINNKTSKGKRRLDLSVGISYDSDIKQAKQIVETIYANDKRILKQPEPRVIVKSLSDSAVVLALRPWVDKKDYSDVLFDMYETVKLEFDAQGIKIPYPQLDVHVQKD